MAASSPIHASPSDLWSLTRARAGMGIYGLSTSGKHLRNEELCSEYEVPCRISDGTSVVLVSPNSVL